MSGVPNIAAWIVSVYKNGKDVTQRGWGGYQKVRCRYDGEGAGEEGFGTNARSEKCARIHISGRRRFATLFFSPRLPGEG